MMIVFKNYLVANRACQTAISWVGEKTIEQAWYECKRVDWMLWLCRKNNIDDSVCKRIVVWAAKKLISIYENINRTNALKINHMDLIRNTQVLHSNKMWSDAVRSYGLSRFSEEVCDHVRGLVSINQIKKGILNYGTTGAKEIVGKD
jgi:hypothetical protein